VSSAIQDLPTAKDWGLGFNYSAWTQGTAITLCNVPWNSDYRDIVRFDNQDALDTYLRNNSGATIEITKLSYAKFGQPIRLDTPFHTVQNYNYIRVWNPAQPITGDTGKAFYYFVTDVTYVNPNCTQITVQLDVWQTFGYGVKFGNCYIQQGHIGIANENFFTNYGRDYLTVPEGMDIGNEYEIYKRYTHGIAGARDGEPDYEVLVVSSVALDTDPGTEDDPKLQSAKGSSMENLPNGAEIYLFNSMEHLQQYLTGVSDKPWITQGIMSIQAVPPMGRYGISTTAISLNGVVVAKVNGGSLTRPYTTVKEGFRNDADLGRYWRLAKFWTYPYTVIEMTSHTGTPIIIKPECLQSSDLGVVEVPHISPPDARIAFYPYRYNASETSAVESDTKGILNDGGEFLDMASWISNFPTFSVVNNGYMSFMASNRNGIAFQHQSADWSQQRTQQGIATSYDQATAGMMLSENLTQRGVYAAGQQTNLQNQTMAAHTMVGGMAGIAQGAIGGAAGGPAGVVAGAGMGLGNALVSGVQTAIDVDRNNQALGISNSLAQGNNTASNATAAYMRDTNKDLATFSANGDYQNALAGINAKVQDAKLTQPTTSGQIGGDAFNLATYRWGVDIKVKRLTPAFMNAIGEYWLRYGYAINRFGKMPESFMVMEKFTYWKLKETYITEAHCPEAFKQVIRGIFEKGVTVWRNPSDIGTIDIANNAPLGGVAI
jgi:hypothetical protein